MSSFLRRSALVGLLLAFGPFCIASEWQYLVKGYNLTGNNDQLSAQLNKLGKQQWELVNCTVERAHLTCIFKRPSR